MGMGSGGRALWRERHFAAWSGRTSGKCCFYVQYFA
jgi:hypothetical protein